MLKTLIKFSDKREYQARRYHVIVQIDREKCLEINQTRFNLEFKGQCFIKKRFNKGWSRIKIGFNNNIFSTPNVKLICYSVIGWEKIHTVKKNNWKLKEIWNPYNYLLLPQTTLVAA